MDDTNECFICLCGDEEVGKGGVIKLKMTRCGCFPYVHSLCLAEWYTGTGANGRDVCPFCRTSGHIHGISEILQRIALSGHRIHENTSTDVSTTPQRDVTEHYQSLRSTETPNTVVYDTHRQSHHVSEEEDQYTRTQRSVGAMFLILCMVLVLTYGMLHI